jgi:hypothetical protein
MIQFFTGSAVILSLLLAVTIYMLQKHVHGKYSGLWYIIASWIYFSLIFFCANYIHGFFK